MDRNHLRAEKVQDFETLFSDSDPQLPPNGGCEGGNTMTRLFVHQYQLNEPQIIYLYENPLGHFY